MKVWLPWVKVVGDGQNVVNAVVVTGGVVVVAFLE